MGGPFQERLEASLTVTLAGKPHRVAPGNVRAFGLHLHPWGLEGSVEFLVADDKAVGGKQKDKVLADFLKPDLGKVALALQVDQADAKKKAKPTALKVQGLVVDKALEELPVTSEPGNKVSYRRYRLDFMDPAALLWRQHHPCALYTSKSFKDVLEAHKGEHIKLAYDWPGVVDASCPQLFVGLDAARGASFYDLLVWYVHSHSGVLRYDYAAAGYKLSAAKESSGEPKALRPEEVESLRVHFPEVIRHEVAVLNSFAEEPKTEAVTQKQKVAGVRQDVLLRTAIADEVQAEVKRQKARLVPRGRELELTWRRFPLEALETLPPGALVKMPQVAEWAASGVPAGDTFRVRHVSLRAVAAQAGPDAEHDAPSAHYELTLDVRLEGKDEAWVELPAFTPPLYPRLAEGFIVSEVGETKDETWQVYQDSATSQDRYKVRMPLWEDQVITVPFEPGLLPGQFYFPAYKGERVLVALDFQKAFLERFLDWRAGVRLPQDAQGVQLLVGKTTQSSTAMKHFYEDGKPVFVLHRINEKDSVKLQLREGGLLLEVKEGQ